MAGYSENDGNKNEYLLFGIHSNAMRFRTNFESIYEKYQKPFLNDDLLDLDNMTILKDNGILQRREIVLFGASKLKCCGKKGIIPENQVLNKTFTIDSNVSMAIIRECDSYIGQAEVDDDEDAETLSPYSSEDDEDDYDDEFYDIDDDDSESGLRKKEYSYESAEASSECSQSTDNSVYSAKENSSFYDVDSAIKFNKPQKLKKFSDDPHYKRSDPDCADSKKYVIQSRKANKCLQKTHTSSCRQSDSLDFQKGAQQGQNKLLALQLDKSKAEKQQKFGEVSSPRQLKNSPRRHNSCNMSPLKPNSNSTQLLYSNTSITSSLKDLKLVSVASPLKCESLNSSRNCSSLNSSPCSTFGSSVGRSISSSTVDWKHKSFQSPKARDNSIIERLLSSPQQNCQKNINQTFREESCVSDISASDKKRGGADFESPTATVNVRRRIIPTKVDHDEKKRTTNSFQNSAAKNACTIFSALPVPKLNEKSISSSVKKSDSCSIRSRYSESSDFNSSRISPSLMSVNSARSYCDKKKSSSSSTDSRYSADFKDSTRVSPSVKSLHSARISYVQNSDSSSSSSRHSPADFNESSQITNSVIPVNSARSRQCMGDFTRLLDGNDNLQPSTSTLPRTTESHLREIVSRDGDINSKTFCVDVSFSSSENDLKSGLQNYDFIFQDSTAKQEPSGCLKKTLSGLEKILTSTSRGLVLHNSESLASPNSFKKFNSRSVQTIDTSIVHTSSLLSRSTQTFNSASNFLESSNSKCHNNSTLARNKCHLISCLDQHLSQHGFDESKWKAVGENQGTDFQARRGLKRKDFSTSDYFTDSSSPRKLRNLMSDHCCCISHSSETEIKSLNSPSLEQPCFKHLSREVGPEKSSIANNHAQQLSALLTRSFQDFNPDSLMKKPIIVDRNKLRKKLAMRGKNNISQKQTCLCTLKTSSNTVDSYCNSLDETNYNDNLSDCANRTFEMHNKNFDFTDKHHAHHECIVRENNTKSCLKKIPVPTSSCHKCEMSSKNCDTFTVIGSRKSCSSPQLGFGTITNCAAPEKCKCLLAAESDQASTKKPDCFIQNKNSSQTVPEMCCCQNKSNRNNSHGCAMFPSTYINRFCPNNPSRIDSDATEPTSNEWSISFESFKEHLKTFRPNRNKVNPPKQPTNLIDTYHHPNPGTVFIPEFDFEQKLSKSRKISSSKSSFKISSSLNRNRLLKSSSLPGNITFNPLRASTPFGELSESDSSFSHKTLSTIREPSCSKDSTTAEDTTLNQTTYSDGSDDVDLLV